MFRTGKIWEVNSADGWNCVVCTCVDTPTSAEGENTLAMLEFRGRFWDRRTLQQDGLGSSKLREDFDVEFFQVLLSIQGLRVLGRSLNEWMDVLAPLDCELGAGHQSVHLTVAPCEELICSAEKPVFRIAYESIRMKATCQFVVDQSCLGMMINDLTAWLGTE